MVKKIFLLLSAACLLAAAPVAKKAKAKPPQDEPGALTTEQIAAVTQKGQKKIEKMYQDLLESGSEVSGKILLVVTIAPSGQVVKVDMKEYKMEDYAFTRAVVGEIKTWVFPESKTTTELKYPVFFQTVPDY
jgi:hypothetical protein